MQPKYWMAISLSAIAVAMWYSTSLAPDASFSYFAWVRIFQVVGLPFMFIPINSVAYDGLPPQKTSEGSALMNVARNLGGSFGVSLANVELLQRSQFHQARLTENVIPSSPEYQSTLSHIMQYFTQVGSPTDAHGLAMGYIGHMITGQATLMAYIDIFYTWAIFAAVLIPIVLLLIRPVAPGTVQAAGH
jgi:MFS transporter, DHA2 family, multidrug resistance protein